MKYILFSLLIISSLFGNTTKQGKFESCETNYYSMYEVRFVTSDEIPCHKLKSKLYTEEHMSISNSFKKGSFESCSLLACPVDYILSQ